MTIHFFTGASAADVALAAAALAQQYAAAGEATLLFSIGPAHYLPFDLVPGLEPHPHTPKLDLLAFDALAATAAFWQPGNERLPSQLRSLSADELPTLPASDTLLGFQRIGELRSRYARVVVAAGPPEQLLQALALVDGLRWGVRLLVGLNQGPGANAASVANALVPTTLLPFDLSSGAQALRLRAEQARAELLDARHSNAVFVLPASAAALREARLAVPALHLHGLRVGALLVSQPPEANDALINQVREIWPNCPVLGFDPGSALAAQLAPALNTSVPPIAFAYQGQPAVTIDLAGMPSGALKLTISGDELILRIGPFRRHLLLPDGLRGITQVRATREGDLLVVRRRS